MVLPSTRYLASFLLEKANLNEWPFRYDFCGQLLWALLLTVLSLAQEKPLISPGYSIRMHHIYVTDLFRKHPENFMEILASAPGKVLQRLPLVEDSARDHVGADFGKLQLLAHGRHVGAFHSRQLLRGSALGANAPRGPRLPHHLGHGAMAATKGGGTGMGKSLGVGKMWDSGTCVLCVGAVPEFP
eukprot:g27573.t1